jgi:hypothetical protein
MARQTPISESDLNIVPRVKQDCASSKRNIPAKRPCVLSCLGSLSWVQFCDSTPPVRNRHDVHLLMNVMNGRHKMA